jgi:glycosyltransferase involved in cell wall biosynthesis
MATTEVRLYGDPLTRGAGALRGFLTRARSVGMRVAICATPIAGDQGGGGRAVQLTDGRREFVARTGLGGPVLDTVLAALGGEVAATAPIVVFGGADLRRQAELEFPHAAAVVTLADLASDVAVTEGSSREIAVAHAVGDNVAHWVAGNVAHWVAALQTRIAALARVADPDGLDDAELLAGGEVAPAAARGFLHLSEQSLASGTDLVLQAFTALHAEAVAAGHEPPGLLVVHRHGVPADLPRQAGVRHRHGLADDGDLAAATALLLPVRTADAVDWSFALRAMAARRLLVLSSFAATNRRLDGRGVYAPIGGRLVERHFEPDPASVLQRMREVVEAPVVAAAAARRGRAHVCAWHRRTRFAAAGGEPRGARPTLVLEAPLFETSSSAVLTSETARALLRRDRIDVWLRPTVPFEGSLSSFAARYPDLVHRLCRAPAGADLWLSAGWPVRLARPAAARWAIRLDWEYGALPAELGPAVTQEADTVVVHSAYVRRTLAGAGRRLADVVTVPHGVDPAVFHSEAPPLGTVVSWKGDRRALLFVGGLIWRKGFDLVVKTLVELDRKALCLVVKTVGGDTSYHGQHLAELIERVRRFPDVPEILVLDADLDGAAMAGLYTACDLLLHPYRGEGFCMPALEARACGLPVLVTDGGSSDDFCRGAAAMAIPSSRRAVALPGAHLGNPHVLDPDPAALRQRLGQMLEQIDGLRAVARVESQAVGRRYSWDRAARALERLTFAAAARAGGATGRSWMQLADTSGGTDEELVHAAAEEHPGRLAHAGHDPCPA